MYLPIIERLAQQGIQVIYFFNFGSTNCFNLSIFKNGLPKIYGNLLDNKIVVSATNSQYKKLKNTIRVQMFHGIGSFGVDINMDFIESYDVLFLQTRSQRQQLSNEYKDFVINKQIFNVGYPKVDNYILAQRAPLLPRKEKVLFYGPTYHPEISSIFSFLDTIVNTCQAYGFKLLIKLHPFLLNKNIFDWSGGIDWVRRVAHYKKKYDQIVFIKQDIGTRNLAKYFQMTNIFVTDVSGLGYEFVMATSKPIIFLGNKLKIPLNDLRDGNLAKYDKFPEIYYRGQIGPIIIDPQKFESTVKKILTKNDYKINIEKFREEYTYNLGNAAQVGTSRLLELFSEL